MSGLRLVNPPRFRNERWEERSGTICRQPLWWLVPVPLTRGTAWDADPPTHRGSPGDLGQPERCLWDLPIGDKWFHVGGGKGSVLCSCSELVPRSHPAPAAAFVLHPRLCLGAARWVSARTAPWGHPRAAPEQDEEPPRWKKLSAQSTCRAQPRWALSLEPSPKTQSDCTSGLRSLLQHRQRFVCFAYRGDCGKAVLDGRTDGHAAIQAARRDAQAESRPAAVALNSLC